MNKWTQVQRDKAHSQLKSLAFDYSSEALSDENLDSAIDLACQRNELLEALRSMERLVVELYPGHAEPEPEHFDEYVAVWSAVMSARAAIAKAEGK